jgi:hypothetical protein
MPSREARIRLMRKVFYAAGALMALGLPFVFITDKAMVEIGALMGLTQYTVDPVFEYLARTLSIVSFIAGLALFYLGARMERELALIRAAAWMTALVLLPLTIVIHLMNSLPPWWVWSEIVGVAAGAAMLFMVPRPAPEAAPAEPEKCGE